MRKKILNDYQKSTRYYQTRDKIIITLLVISLIVVFCFAGIEDQYALNAGVIH